MRAQSFSYATKQWPPCLFLSQLSLDVRPEFFEDDVREHVEADGVAEAPEGGADADACVPRRVALPDIRQRARRQISTQVRDVRLVAPVVAISDEDTTGGVGGPRAEAVLTRRPIAWVLFEDDRVETSAEQRAAAVGGEVDGEAREAIGHTVFVRLLRLMLFARLC